MILKNHFETAPFLVTWFLVLAVAETYFSRAAQSRVSRMLSHVSWVPSFFSF